MSFVKNAWYIASWSADLKEKPIGIKVTGEQIVVYRKEDGGVVALGGVCPHRFASMADGVVKGDSIECPYHGLRFGTEGQCTLNPHGAGVVPPQAFLKHYPAAERHGAVWVWPGNPELADEAKIFDCSFVTDSENWTGVTGYLKVPADYLNVIDNLLDLSHAAFIHPTTLGLPADKVDVSRRKNKFSVVGDVVRSDTIMDDVPPTPTLAPWCGRTVGQLHSLMGLHLPTNFLLDLSLVESPEENDPPRLLNCHLLVPEDENSTHYFFAAHRNRMLDDEAVTADLSARLKKAFVEEDLPMIKACADAMAGRDLFSLNPAILETDKAGVYARRTIEKMARAERAAAEPAAVAASAKVAAPAKVAAAAA